MREPTDCAQIQELISAAQDKELSGKDSETLQSHLAYCPACRSQTEELAQLSETLQLQESPPVDPFLHERIVASVRWAHRSRAREAVWTSKRTLSWAVSLCAMVVFGVLIGRLATNFPGPGDTGDNGSPTDGDPRNTLSDIYEILEDPDESITVLGSFLESDFDWEYWEESLSPFAWTEEEFLFDYVDSLTEEEVAHVREALLEWVSQPSEEVEA